MLIRVFSILLLLIFSTSFAAETIPENAYATDSESQGWKCKPNYVQGSKKCIWGHSNKSKNGYTWEDGTVYSCFANFYKSGNVCLKVPENAYSLVNSTDWKCIEGHQRSGNTCLRQIPENAYVSGNGWKCSSGYERSGNSCIKALIIPSNSYASGNTWYCNSGYKRSGNSCIKPLVVPSNAKAYGNTWKCLSGYKRSGNSCIKALVVPSNAYASGNNWKCLSGYKRSGNSCIKEVYIPANAYASGNSWKCLSGYIKKDNNCRKYIAKTNTSSNSYNKPSSAVSIKSVVNKVLSFTGLSDNIETSAKLYNPNLINTAAGGWMYGDQLYGGDGSFVGYIKNGFIYDTSMRTIGFTSNQIMYNSNGESIGAVGPNIKPGAVDMFNNSNSIFKGSNSAFDMTPYNGIKKLKSQTPSLNYNSGSVDMFDTSTGIFNNNNSIFNSSNYSFDMTPGF